MHMLHNLRTEHSLFKTIDKMCAESYDGQTADTSTVFHDTEHGEREQGAFLQPENEVEDPSIQQDDNGADCTRDSTKHATASCSNVQTPAPHVEILSPRPSPHVPGKNRMAAVVEDWEEEDSRSPAEYISPSPSCVTTPTLVEASPSPDVQENTVKTVKSEPYRLDHGNKSPRRQIEPSDIPTQQSAQQNTSRRRPSVMDYLVSHGPVKYPMSTSRASSSSCRRVPSEGQHWQNYDRLSSNNYRLQPDVFPGYQVEERKQQMGWTAQQPSIRSADKVLNVHDERSSEVPHKRSFSQTWEQNGLPVPSSNHSMSSNDSRPDMCTSQDYPDLASHLDNVAPSGYHLLATKLSGDSCGQPISPIYRRFDALNHRLLLYMQDEINDLERQLTSLEAKDTVKRSYAGGVMPASQRQDRRIDSSLAHQKTEILGLIGYKLSQYNHVLASYCKVQDIPAPTWRDIYTYKSYLATSKLIVDDETRFLDASNDLISLNSQNQATDDLNSTADGPTPMPETAEEEQFQGFFGDNGGAPSARLDQGVTHKPDDALFVRLALSGTCVVLVPIMIFSVIPSFVGRIAIVLLVVLGVSIMVDQYGLLQDVERHRRNWMVYFGLYCGAMTVLAGAVN
ncbi:hypothetical protein E4U53_006458 [Claviceps sorghi]|nr:hypothetical protein E4U53_006458 [Claviceps sorghi]